MSSRSRKIPPLFTHQKADVEFELKNEKVFDTSEPGTGKTRTRLEVFSKRRAKGGKCVLVISPKSLLRSAWEADAKTFTPWLKVSCAYAENRDKAFREKADLYVTNHDATKWLAKQDPQFFDKFDSLIVDESGAYKHHTSDRSKALTKIKKYFKYRVCMNGTPNPRSITDVWNQINILDDGERLGKSFFGFRNATQAPIQVGKLPHFVKWEDKAGSEAAVSSLIKDITIRHTLDECHDIPANHNYVVPFYMTQKLQKAYDEMEATAKLRLRDGEVNAVNAASVVTKLLQIASGAVYEDSEHYHLIDTARYELIGDLVEERKNSVVFFIWKHQKDMLIEELKKRKITYTLLDGSVTDRKKLANVQHFQAGFYRVVLAHPQSAAHGLTLTKGTSTIWASPTYNLEHWIQGNKRIHRAGQKEKTETVNLIAEGTIEEHVYNVLCMKKGKLIDMLEALG